VAGGERERERKSERNEEDEERENRGWFVGFSVCVKKNTKMEEN